MIPKGEVVCLILTVIFITLGVQALLQNDWPFALLYGAIATFFLWLLQNNIKAILRHRGRCGPKGCSLFDLFKGFQKKKDDDDLGHQ